MGLACIVIALSMTACCPESVKMFIFHHSHCNLGKSKSYMAPGQLNKVDEDTLPCFYLTEILPSMFCIDSGHLRSNERTSGGSRNDGTGMFEVRRRILRGIHDYMCFAVIIFVLNIHILKSHPVN